MSTKRRAICLVINKREALFVRLSTKERSNLSGNRQKRGAICQEIDKREEQFVRKSTKERSNLSGNQL
jgi:hypothetical protein